VRVITQPNGGVSAARNRGAAEARATLLAFLDADDAWLPDFLAAIVGLARRFPHAGMYSTGRRSINSDGTGIEIWVALPNGATEGQTSEYFAAPEEGRFVHSSSVAIPVRVFREVGGFPEGERMGEDLDLWTRIALHYPIACTQRVLAIYYHNPQRDLERAQTAWPYSPELRRLRAAIESGQTGGHNPAALRHYFDFVALKTAYCQIELAMTDCAGEALRQERFYARRSRIEAALLRLALRVLPPRVILRIRRTPVQLGRMVRRRLGGGKHQGRVVVVRTISPGL
jgi:glycosyltransferase involved in cell wall biosynthesis